MHKRNKILFPVTLANAVIRHDVVNKQQSSNAFPPPQSVKILEQVQERVRYLHYSSRTEAVYLHWIRFFIRWSGMRLPREMGADEVRQFPTFLAVKRNVLVSTQRMALSGLLFLYKKVLCVDLPWLDGFERPSVPRRLPTVLTREEVARIVALLSGDHAVSRVCSTRRACASGRGSAQNYGLKNHDDLLPCTESRGARRDQSAGPDVEQR